MPEETASEGKTIVSRNSAGKRRRSKKLVVAAVKSPFFERARDNPSLRYAYILFLCTLLPFVAIYTYVRTVYFTERSEHPSSFDNDNKVPDSDDTSATASQDSSEHTTSPSSDDDGDKRSLEMDTGRFLTEEDYLFEIQRRSLKKRTATVPRNEEYTIATPKSGFWKSLSNSNQVLKVILVEDSSF